MKSVLSVKGKKIFKSLFSCLLAITLICSSSISSFAYGGSHTYYPTIENIPLNNPVWNFVKHDFIYPFFDGIYDTLTFNENSNMKWLNDINPLTQAIKYFVPQTTHGGGGSSRDPIIVNDNPVQVPRPIIKNNYDYSSHDVTNEIYNIENNSYETINNTYVYNNDYYIYETDNYYISYEYEINYYSIVVAPISDPSQGKYFKLFYELPDGRSSYNLKPSDIRGTVFIYDVINYDRVVTDNSVLGLWHLDGDFYNSVDNSNYQPTGLFSSNNFVNGRFDGAVTNFNGTDFPTIVLPYSGSVPSTYTIEFWMYVPYQDTVINSSLANGNGVTGYKNITVTDGIPQESWNHIAICSDGSWFVNGNKVSTNVPSWLFGSSDSVVSITDGRLKFQTKYGGGNVLTVGGSTYQPIYGYRFTYDEVKLSNGIVYNSSFSPRLQPWDLNFAYTVPHGEYWEDVQQVYHQETPSFEGFSEGRSLGDLTPYNLYFPIWNYMTQFPASYDSSTEVYSSYIDFNSSGVSLLCVPTSYFDSSIPFEVLTGKVSVSFYESDWSLISFSEHDSSGSILNINVPSNATYVMFYSINGVSSFKFSHIPNSFSESNGGLTLLQNRSLDGFVYAPLNASSVQSLSYEYDGVPENLSLNFSASNYDLYLIFESGYSSSVGYYLDIYFASAPNPINKVYQIVRHTSSQSLSKTISDIQIGYYESVVVDSGYYDFERPTIAIQSPFNVHEAQIGGIRKNNPTVGDVFIDLDDNRATVVSQYYNGVWNAVNGAIFIEGKWHDLLKYDFSTLMLAEESNTDTPTVIIINNYYYGSDSVSGNDFYDPSQTTHPDDPTASDGSLTVLKKISKTLNLWFAAWAIGSGDVSVDIDESNTEVHWYDLLLPLIYVLYLFIVLLSILGLVQSCISYLFHLISIQAYSSNLPDGFIEAFKWLRGEIDNPFYLLDVSGVQVTCFDFMVLIFEIAFIGTTIMIIRKHLNNINVPSYKD